jgi:hypothetical protein
MARINVTLPDSMIERVRREMPGLNVSGVLQGALIELVGCEHRDLVCACCGAKSERRAIELTILGRFYQEAIWKLETPIRRVATAEGAARVLRDVARSWEVPTVDRTPLPRPTRAQREHVHQELLREAEREAVAMFESGTKPRRRAAGAA